MNTLKNYLSSGLTITRCRWNQKGHNHRDLKVLKKLNHLNLNKNLRNNLRTLQICQLIQRISSQKILLRISSQKILLKNNFVPLKMISVNYLILMRMNGKVKWNQEKHLRWNRWMLWRKIWIFKLKSLKRMKQ